MRVAAGLSSASWLLFSTLLWAAPGAPELRSLVDPLLAAKGEGRIGQVAVSALLAARSADGPPTPRPGVVFALLPRSPALVKELERIKAAARDSEAGYLEAATNMAALSDRYAQSLREAGAGDLVFAATADGRGEHLFAQMPAGEWLLVGRDERVQETPARAPSKRERERFVLPSRLRGYRDVTFWLMDVTVVQGRVTKLSLTDRNPWFRGVVQERRG